MCKEGIVHRGIALFRSGMFFSDGYGFLLLVTVWARAAAGGGGGGGGGGWRPPPHGWRPLPRRRDGSEDGAGTARRDFDVVSAATLTPKAFEARFRRPQRPVLLRGAADGWAAQRTWTRAFLRATLADVRFPAVHGRGLDNILLVTDDQNRSLSAPLDEDDEDEDAKVIQWYSSHSRYVFRPLDDGRLPGSNFRPADDIEIPPYFAAWTSPAPTTFFSVGPHDSGLGFHSHHEAWNGIVAGVKRFFLVPPSALEDRQHEDLLAELMSSLKDDTERLAWLEALPSYPDSIRPLECFAHKGDVLYIPHHYEHAVFNVGETVSLSTTGGGLGAEAADAPDSGTSYTSAGLPRYGTPPSPPPLPPPLPRPAVPPPPRPAASPKPAVSTQPVAPSQPTASSPQPLSSSIDSSSIDNGGWTRPIEPDPAGRSRAPPACEWDEVEATELSVLDFLGKYEAKERPVMIRNGARSWAAHEKWTKAAVLHQLRNVQFAGHQAGLADVLTEQAGPRTTPALTPDPLHPTFEEHTYSKHGLYHFRALDKATGHVPQTTFSPLRDLETPKYFRHWTVGKNHSVGGATFFSVGSEGSGLTFHSHTEAWCGLVWGTKHWLLVVPPWLRTSSEGDTSAASGGNGYQDPGENIAEMLERVGDTAHERQRFVDGLKGLPNKPLECLQHKGDLLYIPAGFMHMVVNIGETVGISVTNLETNGDDMYSSSSGLPNYRGVAIGDGGPSSHDMLEGVGSLNVRIGADGLPYFDELSEETIRNN